MEYDSLLQTYEMIVQPTSNLEVGTYTVSLEKKLIDYPNKIVADSVFEIEILPTVNQAPVFTEELNVFHVVYKLAEEGTDSELSTWSYLLPTAIDPDGDTFYIEVVDSNAAMAFVSLDPTKGELSIADLGSPDVTAGQFTITVQLNDGKDQS